MEEFNARAYAFKLAQEKYTVGDAKHGKFSSIYMGPTSNVKDAMSVFNDYKNVLSVGGMGAYAFEAALNNAERVDMFDVNYLQKLYYFIIETAIIYLDYEDFIKHFTISDYEKISRINNGSAYYKTDISDLMSNEIYEYLSWYLPEEVTRVFDHLYEFYYSVNLMSSRLFRSDYILAVNQLKTIASMYNKEEYNKLKEILIAGKCKFTYETVSLTEVPKFYDKKYDLIILDNILQYYQNVPELNTPYLTNMFIQKELSKLLTDEGVIMVNYAFEIGTDAVKKKFDIPINRKLDFIKNAIIATEVKEGINVPLLSKWDGYAYHFIPGVERDAENPYTDNMVLTWKKVNR